MIRNLWSAKERLDLPGEDGTYTETDDCLPSSLSALLSTAAKGGGEFLAPTHFPTTGLLLVNCEVSGWSISGSVKYCFWLTSDSFSPL